MKKHFIISWTIYPFDVLVSIGETKEEVEKHIKKTGYKLNDNEKDAIELNSLGKTAMLRGGQTIIRLRNTNIGILAHEAFHATSFLMDRIGVKLTMESDEAYAYALQYLINEIQSNIKKR